MHFLEWISIKIPLKFVPRSTINNIPSLVQIMAWRRRGDKPLSELRRSSGDGTKNKKGYSHNYEYVWFCQCILSIRAFLHNWGCYHWPAHVYYINGLVQDCSNSSALLPSCTKPSNYVPRNNTTSKYLICRQENRHVEVNLCNKPFLKQYQWALSLFSQQKTFH